MDGEVNALFLWGSKNYINSSNLYYDQVVKTHGNYIYENYPLRRVYICFVFVTCFDYWLILSSLVTMH